MERQFIATALILHVEQSNIAVFENQLHSPYEYVAGEFITVAERKRRATGAAERNRLLYADPQTGLIWADMGAKRQYCR